MSTMNCETDNRIGEKADFPNILLLCGSGQNTGKTLLACNIIQHWKQSGPVNAVKISMHRHDHDAGMELLCEAPGYSIWKENTISTKDSGRFLGAGAEIVLYIETDDLHLRDAFHCALSFVGRHSKIVCESGGLVKFIRPGLMLFVQLPGMDVDKDKMWLRAMADKVVYFGSEEISRPDSFLGFGNGGWKLAGNSG